VESPERDHIVTVFGHHVKERGPKGQVAAEGVVLGLERQACRETLRDKRQRGSQTGTDKQTETDRQTIRQRRRETVRDDKTQPHRNTDTQAHRHTETETETEAEAEAETGRLCVTVAFPGR
jgi:ABC-type nickel/cobalt efflux system permease component RcnA